VIEGENEIYAVIKGENEKMRHRVSVQKGFAREIQELLITDNDAVSAQGVISALVIFSDVSE